MPSEEEFDEISNMIDSILGDKQKSDEQRAKEEEALQREYKKQIAELESTIIEKKKYVTDRIEEDEVQGYFIPKGTEILVPKSMPKDIYGREYLLGTDFKTIITTKDVRYDPEDLIFDKRRNLSNLPVKIGVWADEMLGFRLPPNNKNVEFFLVLRRIIMTYYNDKITKWLNEVLNSSKDNKELLDSIYKIYDQNL